MKVTSIKSIIVGVVTTDSQFYIQYQRVNGENWLQLIKDSWQGDCWHTVNMNESRELELAYQEFLRVGEVIEDPQPVEDKRIIAARLDNINVQMMEVIAQQNYEMQRYGEWRVDFPAWIGSLQTQFDELLKQLTPPRS